MTLVAPSASTTGAGRVSPPRPWGLYLAIAFAGAALVIALVGPDVLGVDPLQQNLRARNRPPMIGHWLGTDHLGRDILARLVFGLRMSLIVAALALGVAAFFGITLGLAAAAAGGVIETAFFGFIDLLRAMPGVLLALVLVAAFGAGLLPVAFAVGLTFAPTFAVVARLALQREMGFPYVEAVRAMGAGRQRIAFRHVLPNIAGPLVTLTAIVFPRCIVTESVMSFLGLGVSPEMATWGRMIAQAARFFETNPNAVLAPTLALAGLTLAVALIGTALRRRLDPLRRDLVA